MFDLRLDAYESGFVVCRHGGQKGASVSQKEEAFPAMESVLTVKGPWTVLFDPAWGGPGASSGVVFNELLEWSAQADPGIKYYSGIALYRTTFDAPAGKSGQRLFLSLGEVQKIARVKINGETLGTVWTPPFRVEVTGNLKPAANLLEIEVANTWVNRLVGDQQPGNKGIRTLSWENGLLAGKPVPAGRYTFTTVSNYTEKSPLQRSGLMGPVQLQVARKDGDERK